MRTLSVSFYILQSNKHYFKSDIEIFYHISREKFEPEPGLEFGPPDLFPGSRGGFEGELDTSMVER